MRGRRRGVCHSRNVKEHVLINFLIGGCLEVTRSSSFDLDSASRLLLDILHIRPTMADNLCAQVEAGSRVDANGYLFFRPFPLRAESKSANKATTLGNLSHPSIFVALDLLLLLLIAPAKAALIDQLREFLLHELPDFGNSSLETFLRRARDMKIQRRVLKRSISLISLRADVSGQHVPRQWPYFC